MEPADFRTHILPVEVKNFLINFYNAIYDRNHDLIEKLYEQDFIQLTETYYPTSRWPADNVIETFYKQKEIANGVVLSLYRELYFRHVLSRCSSTVDWNDRYLSCCNYIRLFEYFITQESLIKIENRLVLPAQWLWDMVDEYLYQLQETQKWKAQFSKDLFSGQASLLTGKDAWRTYDVIRMLKAIIQASQIKDLLSYDSTLAFHHSGRSQTIDSFSLLGYFAIISLTKLYVGLGCYNNALKTAELLNINSNALYWKVPASHLTTIYNLAFIYFMLRRYQDASKLLNQVLVYYIKSKNFNTAQTYQQQMLSRMTDKMFYLLMLCNSLNFSSIDESVSNVINEKWNEKFIKLHHFDEDTIKETFIKACPKFFYPSEHIYMQNISPLDCHLLIFLKHVKYQNKIHNLQSIAKLYNNLTLKKLYNLMSDESSSNKEIARSEILSVKCCAQQQVLHPNSFISKGEKIEALSNLIIFLDQDILYVKSIILNESYLDEVLNQIYKTQEITQNAYNVYTSNRLEPQ